MEVGIIFKIGAVGILVSVLGQVLKHSGKEEQAFLTSHGSDRGIILGASYIYELFETIKKLFTFYKGAMEIVRISVIRDCRNLLAVLVKGVRPEYAFYITMAAGLAILFFSVGKLSYLLEALREMKEYIPIETTYVNILLKMIGITYIGQFSAGLCKDAGYQAVASQIQIFGRLAVLAVSMPVLTALLETIHEFLG